MSEEEWQERLELGEMIAGWTMNVLEDILSEGTVFSSFSLLIVLLFKSTC